MRTAIAAVIILVGLLTTSIAAEKPLNERQSNDFAHNNDERQPLLSPEHYDIEMVDFIRIKRGDSSDSSLAMSTLQRFQNFLLNCKGECGEKLGFAPNEIKKSLLHEEHPTPKEKCLMACVLERTRIMNSQNRVSVEAIGNLAGMISHKNDLVIAIAKISAEHCNRFITTSNKCEAAFQINRCLAHGLKAHKIQIVY